jgi:hypothetical protein
VKVRCYCGAQGCRRYLGAEAENDSDSGSGCGSGSDNDDTETDGDESGSSSSSSSSDDDSDDSDDDETTKATVKFVRIGKKLVKVVERTPEAQVGAAVFLFLHFFISTVTFYSFFISSSFARLSHCFVH